jgi:hypothetical protein
MVEAKATMRRIGLQLIAQKREEVLAEIASNSINDKRRPRDILSLLSMSSYRWVVCAYYNFLCSTLKSDLTFIIHTLNFWKTYTQRSSPISTFR